MTTPLEQDGILAPGLLARTELSLLASRAAIALDECLRTHEIRDMAPIRQLGSVLALGLGETVGTHDMGPARLADPETEDLLSRVANVVTQGTAIGSGQARATARAFVDASRQEPHSLVALGSDKIVELRDFSVGLSIAARSPRAGLLEGRISLVG